jgi:hypothetical protein
MPLISCSGNLDKELEKCAEVQKLTLKLLYPENTPPKRDKGALVTLKDNYGTVFQSVADKNKEAKFTVPGGVYSASVSDVSGGLVYNGNLADIVVKNNSEIFYAEIKLSLVSIKRLIIKELYCGGCQIDDGSDYTRNDKYITVYNNGAESLRIRNLSIAVTMPYNSTANNNNYSSGSLIYENQGFTPAAMGIWYYPGELEFKPFEEKVISIYGAVNHQETYSNSVNLANKNYYVLYDESCEKYSSNTDYYPSPYYEIPKSHYFKTVVYGLGNSWVVSVTSPAMFVFQLEDNPKEFCNDERNRYFDGNKSGSWGGYGASLKIPNAWILDAVEVFDARSDKNTKRFSPSVSVGNVYMSNKYGYTLYRNVDKEATESLKENAGKIIYGYTLGTQDIERGSTDPSGIDAEASIKNGAHIIFCNTNNSSADFHQRRIAAIKNRK